MIKQLLLIGTVAISSLATAQSLTNGGFESWTTVGTYEEPNGWATFNIVSGFSGMPVPTTKLTDAHSGMYAARIETIAADFDGNGITDTLPGIIYNGTLDLASSDPAIGTPFTARPDSPIGWYKYAPVNVDMFMVQVMLSKWNGTSREDIAMGTLSGSSAVTDFMRMSIPLEYGSATTPDSMAVMVVASSGDQPVPGTVIWVDDLSFVMNSTASAAPQPSEVPIRLYPNPARDVLNVVLADDATIHVYNALGKEVDILKGNASKTVTIVTSAYDNGVYLLKTDAGIVQRFVVKH